jgi:hypothetical protein
MVWQMLERGSDAGNSPSHPASAIAAAQLAARNAGNKPEHYCEASHQPLKKIFGQIEGGGNTLPSRVISGPPR